MAILSFLEEWKTICHKTIVNELYVSSFPRRFSIYHFVYKAAGEQKQDKAVAEAYPMEGQRTTKRLKKPLTFFSMTILWAIPVSWI